MTALALCAQDLHIAVSGSDTDDKFVTDEMLESRGLKSSSDFSPENIPPETDLLVYTGAHSGPKNPEVISALQKNIKAASHAQALGELMQGKIGVSVCGVGGKSTTTAMLATILDKTSQHPSFAVGVGSINPLGAPGRYNVKGDVFIAEADEYATAPGFDQTPRFMWQKPKIIICTNIAHDHPDIYPTFDDTKKTFLRFFQTLPSDGILVINGDDSVLVDLSQNVKAKVVTYTRKSTLPQLSVPGEYNRLNAQAAVLAANELGISQQQALEAIKTFKGTSRRFEIIGQENEIIYLDDYAHHPQEILAVLKAARQWYKDYHLLVIFQPHTFSRTKALFHEFSQSFKEANQVVITDIYASARESIDPSISGQKLANEIAAHQPGVTYQPTANLVQYLRQNLKPKTVCLTLGAGDIYKIHDELFTKKS